MINLPITELLSIWSELDDAFHGKNGFGGDTAEIYAYRLWSDEPLIREFPKDSMIRKNAEKERHQNAVNSLLNILSLFARNRECYIEIDGEPQSDWHRTYWDFTHRAHIRVIKRGAL